MFAGSRVRRVCRPTSGWRLDGSGTRSWSTLNRGVVPWEGEAPAEPWDSAKGKAKIIFAFPFAIPCIPLRATARIPFAEKPWRTAQGGFIMIGPGAAGGCLRADGIRERMLRC